MKFFVYALLDPRTKNINIDGIELLHQPFYIGKGHGNRASHHLKSDKINKYKVQKIKEIRQDGYEPLIINLVSDLDEKNAYEKEKEIINYIGLNNLTNITPGGKGMSRENMLGEKNPMFGKKRPKWILNKMVEGSRKNGVYGRFKGKKLEEICGIEKAIILRKKFSKDRLGKSLENRVGKDKADEIKLIMNNKKIGKKYTQLHKDKISKKASLPKNIKARNDAVKIVREKRFEKIFEENKNIILDLLSKGFEKNEILKRIKISKYMLIKIIDKLK